MKLIKVAVVMAMVLFMVAPAFAEMKLNGYYRLQGMHYDDDGATDADDWFTQRLRMKLTNTLNENVSFVYYGEVDLDFGGGDKFGGNGGKLGADGNAIETKNVYLTLKNDNMSLITGIQDTKDIFSGFLVWDDAAGVNFKTKLGAADLNLIYSKFSEGTRSVDDDRDFYGATLAMNATDAVKISGAVYVDDMEASDAQNVYYGLRADAKVSDMVNVTAFGVVADMENGDSYVLDANANFKLANGNVLAEAMFIPEADVAGDTFAQVSPLYYNKHNTMLMFRDIYATNNVQGEGNYNDAFADGLTLLALSGNFDFDVVYAGLGLLWAEGDTFDIGTEMFAKVGKKFFGNVDVSLRAAQWAGGSDGAFQDDETKVIGMINVGF